MHIVSLTIKHH